MYYIESSPQLEIIRDSTTPIPEGLLHPEHEDPRFQPKNVARVVFLAPDVILNSNGRVEDAEYMNSDGYNLWDRFADFANSDQLPVNSASYFETALNELLPKLHKNSPVISSFGRNIPGLKLQAVTSAVNLHTFFAYNEFVVAPQPSDRK
jgi:hypothetical protein